MNLAASVLEHTLVYREWQTPFAGQRFALVPQHNVLHMGATLWNMVYFKGRSRT
jgi:hypothetical protein